MELMDIWPNEVCDSFATSVKTPSVMFLRLFQAILCPLVVVMLVHVIVTLC